MKMSRIVLLLASILFLWKLGAHDLWAPDEPYFAEGAREMVVDGRWAVPHVNGVVTPDKPPLFFWLIAVFSLPLGAVTSWTARLPSALAALATLALTLRLGGRLFGPRTAALAGVLLATSYMFWEKARWSQTDALLCLAIWVAFSAFESFRSAGARGLGAGLLFWLAAALAVLVKGPVGLILPLGIVLVSLAIEGELGRWRRFAPVWGPIVFAVVVAGWMVLATVGGHGEYSVWGSLRDHFINRGLHGMHHRQPPWYYLGALPPSLMPWTGLLPGALVLAWRRRLWADRFLLVAALFPLVFFSIFTEKRELYVLPAFPAFALLAASLVAVVCRWDEPPEGSRAPMDRRWVSVGQGIAGSLLAIVGLGLLVGATVAELPVPSLVALMMGAVLLGTGASTLFLVVRGRVLAAVLASGVGAAVACLVVVSAVYPALEPGKSARSFSLEIKEVTAASRAQGLPVLSYDLSNLPEAFSFYSDGVYTVETSDPVRLADHLGRSEQVFAVVNGAKLDALPASLRERLWVVSSTRLSRREVLLLTNRPYPESKPLTSTESPSAAAADSNSS